VFGTARRKAKRLAAAGDVDGLLDLLEDDRMGARKHAVRALADLGDLRAVPALAALASRPDEEAEVVDVALGALGQLGHAGGIRGLEAGLRHPEKAIRCQAARALAHLPRDVAVPPLLTVMRDAEESWWVQHDAATSLGALGAEQAVSEALELDSVKPQARKRLRIELRRLDQRAPAP
jgi:HEAT repeat protein